jgi:hypothetical protein
MGNMGTMKWPLLAVVALAIVCVSLPATADAKVPCRNQVFNDWEHDGQIASTYPLACYRDALRHVPTTEQIYTSLEDDIRAAMQAAIARLQGKKVPSQIGHRFTTTNDSSSLVDRRPSRDEQIDPTSTDPTKVSSQLNTAGSSGGGVPVPLIVLGGVALALVASGAVGMLVRRRRAS